MLSEVDGNLARKILLQHEWQAYIKRLLAPTVHAIRFQRPASWFILGGMLASIRRCAVLLLASSLLPADTIGEVRTTIIAAIQRTWDALRRGDADTALQMDTDDWVSITIGEKPRTRRELEPYIRRDIASMKPPQGWSVVWNPDSERNGLSSGIQLYDLKLDGDTAVVLYLIGSVNRETIHGEEHSVWVGSHIRDTWTKTSAGWKRRMHEKLTLNERIVDGKK
jgi:hypothetical protein